MLVFFCSLSLSRYFLESPRLSFIFLYSACHPQFPSLISSSLLDIHAHTHTHAQTHTCKHTFGCVSRDIRKSRSSYRLLAPKKQRLFAHTYTNTPALTFLVPRSGDQDVFSSVLARAKAPGFISEYTDSLHSPRITSSLVCLL